MLVFNYVAFESCEMFNKAFLKKHPNALYFYDKPRYTHSSIFAAIDNIK